MEKEEIEIALYRVRDIIDVLSNERTYSALAHITRADLLSTVIIALISVRDHEQREDQITKDVPF